MKFLEKNHGFMQPSGLEQGKLVAINVFNILKLFSLGFFFFCWRHLQGLKEHSLVCV